MATQTFHSKIAAENGTASNELVSKSQLDTAEASAKARANHTGTQTVSTLSDFTSAVNTLIAAVVGAAPTALNTLVELAAALDDDPDFAGTVTTQLGTLDSRIDALEASTGAGNYVQTFGDNTLSTFTITHDLGTLDVAVDVVRISDGQDVFPVVKRPSVDTVSLDFGATVPATNSHRVLIGSRTVA